jgi:VIT family
MRTIHKEAHLIERIGWLRAAVLGANDGLIWTSSLIVGVAAATTAQHEILVAGIAGLVAGPWGIRTSSLWYAIVGNTAPAGSYAAARKSNLRWLRAPATISNCDAKSRRSAAPTGRLFCVRKF